MNATPSLEQLAADVDLAGTDDVTCRILDATRSLVADDGLKGLTMDAVAKAAGIGRATLYRRFSSRDELMRCLVARELSGALAKVAEVLKALDDVEDRIVEAFAQPVELARGNPLLTRLMTTEPESVLPAMTLHADLVLQVARANLIAQLSQARNRGALRDIDIEIMAEVLIRIAHSLILAPGGPIDADDPVALRRFVRINLARPMLRSRELPS